MRLQPGPGRMIEVTTYRFHGSRQPPGAECFEHLRSMLFQLLVGSPGDRGHTSSSHRPDFGILPRLRRAPVYGEDAGPCQTNTTPVMRPPPLYSFVGTWHEKTNLSQTLGKKFFVEKVCLVQMGDLRRSLSSERAARFAYNLEIDCLTTSGIRHLPCSFELWPCAAWAAGWVQRDAHLSSAGVSRRLSSPRHAQRRGDVGDGHNKDEQHLIVGRTQG